MSSKRCFGGEWDCKNISTLERELPYIAKLCKYLEEKSFGSLDTYSSNDQGSVCCIRIPNITSQFGNSVIVPWVLMWHTQYRGGSAEVPTVKYDTYKTQMNLTIIFSPPEMGIIERVFEKHKDYI